MRSPLPFLRSYLAFLARHRRLISFGLFTATLSGFGQTFFIGIFNPNLRAEFGLGHGQVGLVYGAATLTSAAALTYVGRLYDRVDLRLFLTGAALVLAAGCMVMAGGQGLALLFVALLLLRHGGQGLMGHISLTTMARQFFAGRGKAVSVAALGFTLAEATFPPVAVALLAYVEWRAIWWLAAGTVLFLFLPLLLWLLQRARGGGEALPELGSRQELDWTPRQALKDCRFALILPAALAAPFIVTVMFFHLVPLAQGKGWPLELMAFGISMFAVGHVIGLIGGGPLVDWLSARRTIAPALLPMAAALGVLAGFEARAAALLWPGLLGLSMGLAETAVSALLAELYGPTHLGSIRAVLQALMVVSTAIGPPLIGWMLDLGAATELIAVGFAAWAALAALLAWFAVGRSQGQPEKTKPAAIRS